MNFLPTYYTKLFNAVTDAIAAIEQQNYGTARDILIEAQKASEEVYLAGGEEQ